MQSNVIESRCNGSNVPFGPMFQCGGPHGFRSVDPTGSVLWMRPQTLRFRVTAAVSRDASSAPKS